MDFNELVSFLSVITSIPVIIVYFFVIKVLRRLCDYLDLKIIESERNLDKFL